MRARAGRDVALLWAAAGIWGRFCMVFRFTRSTRCFGLLVMDAGESGKGSESQWLRGDNSQIRNELEVFCVVSGDVEAEVEGGGADN